MNNEIIPSQFFQRQKKARQQTTFLIFLFFIAILGTSLLIASIYYFTATYFFSDPPEKIFKDFLYIVIGTFIIIGLIGLFKRFSLSGASGASIAKDLGGRQVDLNTQDILERRLINVVQEMSIASGVLMPDIFILDNEKSINAFAAGSKISNACIAVSDGALRKLNREELQGVVGHEFSHILNGDMKLNIKLIGWIFGLLSIYMIGHILVRINYRSSKNEKNILPLIGIVLLIIGFLGKTFAEIIQAAISRQREHLADASSTQFTRNPMALANALSKIGGDSSYIKSPKSSEYSHFFFANAMLYSFFSTHPPLETRIRLLNPSWDGHFLKPGDDTPKNTKNYDTNDTIDNLREKKNPRLLPIAIEMLCTSHNGALALCYLILMSDSHNDDKIQADILFKNESPEIINILQKNWDSAMKIPEENRIQTILLAAPQLKNFNAKERNRIYSNMKALVLADNNISFFEFCVLKVIESILICSSEQKNTPTNKEIQTPANLIFNLFLHSNELAPSQKPEILKNALQGQKIFTDATVLNNSDIKIPELNQAFDILQKASIIEKETLFDICKKIAYSDNKISTREKDLLNAFSLSITGMCYQF